MARNFNPETETEDGLQPGRVKSFGEVAKDCLHERVDRRGLRTAREVRRHIERYVLPHWEKTAINALRRSTVNDLLRHIEREHGYVAGRPRACDLVVAVPLVCQGG